MPHDFFHKFNMQHSPFPNIKYKLKDTKVSLYISGQNTYQPLYLHIVYMN